MALRLIERLKNWTARDRMPDNATVLTLRDIFAAAAVIGLAASLETKETASNLAAGAYKVADAMLAERDKELAQ